MVVIGMTGTGKSTLCNILSGQKHDNEEMFPVSQNMDSCTNITTAERVCWRGSSSNFPFTLIDTRGLNDPLPGKDTNNIAEMCQTLKDLKTVNTFVIVFNGSNPRFDLSLISMIKIFQGMFGQKFLEKLHIKFMYLQEK